MIPYKRVPNLANKLLTKKQTNKPPDISHSATRKHQCTQQIDVQAYPLQLRPHLII